MPELLRTIVGRLRAVVSNRRRAPRKRLRLACSVSLHEEGANAARRGAAQLRCHTRDLSATGVCLVTPAIRIGERYLTNSALRLTIEHPAGAIDLVAQPVRYEQLPPDSDDGGFIIGARIVSMSDEDRARYRALLN